MEMAVDIKQIKLQQKLVNEQIDSLNDQVSKQTICNKEKDEKMSTLEKEISNLKAHSMRNNRLFRNVSPSGQSEDVYRNVKTVLNIMQIENAEEIDIERVHRLGPRGSDTPIVVKFTSFRDRSKV